MSKITIDAERCTGHAQCALHAPDVFELDDLGHGALKTDTLDARHVEQAERGALACPEGAISLDDAVHDHRASAT